MSVVSEDRNGMDGCMNFAREVAVAVSSPAIFAVTVALPAIAGAASPADLAEVVAVGVASLADAGMVTVGVADLADAGVAFPADPAGAVTVGVASPADAGMATVGVTDLAVARAAPLADTGLAFPDDPAGIVAVGVTSLADAGIVFPADIAGEATVGVTSLADAGMVTVGVTDLADVTPVDVVGVPECGGVHLLPGVWCRERNLIQKLGYTYLLVLRGWIGIQDRPGRSLLAGRIC